MDGVRYESVSIPSQTGRSSDIGESESAMVIESQYLLKQVGPQTTIRMIIITQSLSQYLLKQVGPQTDISLN